MANMFALILVIATLVTGILWCVDKFFFAPKRRERQAAAQAAAGDSLDKATLKNGCAEAWLAGNRCFCFSGTGYRIDCAFVYY